MNIILALLIVLLVLGGLLSIAAKVFEGMSEILTEAKKAMVGMLGRKSLNAQPTISGELADNKNPLPKNDPDKQELLKYDPKPFCAPSQPAVPFVRRSEWLDRAPETSTEISIERIKDLLMMTSLRPYEPLFEILDEAPDYPAPPPIAPSPVPAPPMWTPWRPDLPDPAFEPPFYQGRLSFLNRYVKGAYKNELDAVETARARKQELLALCDKRNQEVAELAARASKRHEQAQKRQDNHFRSLCRERDAHVSTYKQAFEREREKIRGIHAAIHQQGETGLLARVDLALRCINLPSFVSRDEKTRYDAASGILIHEHRFPDLNSVTWIKLVELKAGLTNKPANQKEAKEAASLLYPSLCLRLAAEIARLDYEGLIKAVAINGWADYTEKSTGKEKRAYCASLFATVEQIADLNLSALNPLAAFSALKGVAARSLDLTPIVPVLRLDATDPRFVDAKEVLSKLKAQENLAAMDWEDFEHLCRELFEKAFADSGAEVKITQASRDQGVDAVVFDPDPLWGGKIVIQAKRYTNTVDVSAVRDLYGAVINEGATKGIIVTTSHFGPESYAFAKDKPLTLLNGNELLGLLQTHGYSFRIDLHEAKARIS